MRVTIFEGSPSCTSYKSKVPPSPFSKSGSFVLFEVSPNSFHAVSELIVDKKRYALAGWFHGD